MLFKKFYLINTYKINNNFITSLLCIYYIYKKLSSENISVSSSLGYWLYIIIICSIIYLTSVFHDKLY